MFIFVFVNRKKALIRKPNKFITITFWQTSQDYKWT